MLLRTEINPRFLLRMGLVGVLCVGMAFWCTYDGAVVYPTQRERGLAFLAFEEENPSLGKLEVFQAWEKVAAERGWEPGIAGKEHTPYGEAWAPYKINQQFYMGGFIGLIGLFFVGRFLCNRGCWIEADDHILRSSEKREVKFDQITALNKKQWASKGIARVLYEVDGRKNKIVLDDCNYDRNTTVAILRHVEAKIDAKKITNGKPEPPLKKTPPGEAASAAG